LASERSDSFEVGERIERGLQVAGAAQTARQIAGLVAQLASLGAQERIEQPQQRAPALDGAAEIVHRLGVGFGRVLQGRAPIGKDVAGHRAQRRPHRQARPQGGLVVHAGTIRHWYFIGAAYLSRSAR
jgi:hypothetical protein